MNEYDAAKAVKDLCKTIFGEELCDFVQDLADICEPKASPEENLRIKLSHMTDEELTAKYVPDVYQKDIYSIDYERLGSAGINLIFFDMDDLISSDKECAPQYIAKLLFDDLKRKGFDTALLTENSDEKTKAFANALSPARIAAIKTKRGLDFDAFFEGHSVNEKARTAVVGKYILRDIKCGNKAGLTTCLIRKGGKPGKKAALKNRIVAEELASRGLWFKHHQYKKGDQYYRLGEVPSYKKTDDQADAAKGAADDLIQKTEAHTDETIKLQDEMRESYKQMVDDAERALSVRLGEDILIAGTWEAANIRELDDDELLDDEISGFIGKVGDYLVRQTECAYRDDDEFKYKERKPLSKDLVIECRKNIDLCSRYDNICRAAAKVMAKHKNMPGQKWQTVCYADQAGGYDWSEDIDFICAVKRANVSEDDRQALFVYKETFGDSFDCQSWYKLTPDGVLKEYRIRDFGLNPNEVWQLFDAPKYNDN